MSVINGAYNDNNVEAVGLVVETKKEVIESL